VPVHGMRPLRVLMLNGRTTLLLQLLWWRARHSATASESICFGDSCCGYIHHCKLLLVSASPFLKQPLRLRAV